MSLEDDFTDIIKKARMGRGLSVDALAKEAGLTAQHVSAIERGEHQPSPVEIAAIGTALKLRVDPLSDIAGNRWEPLSTAASLVQGAIGVETVLGSIGGYAVKGYVVYDVDTKDAVFVDTAYNAGAMLDVVLRLGLRLTGICLTHGHADHSDGIEQILATRPVPVYLGHEDEPLLSWHPARERLNDPEDDRTIQVGRLSVRCMTTPGHTPGGLCYRVDHQTRPICFVGDTLFAGSIGRSNPAGLYPMHLDSVRRRVLQLSPNTLLLPGHGPATTVGEEIVHNPFATGS
jgi:glyoxylase-like metal-dependent hydrolase (beta-lactamase superfamily II)/DNA-binding XRE family transcriptional regulator